MKHNIIKLVNKKGNIMTLLTVFAVGGALMGAVSIGTLTYASRAEVTAQVQPGEGLWRVEEIPTASELPGNFRLMTDNWHRELITEAPSRAGLDTLRISGSRQPAVTSLAPLYQSLEAAAGKEAPIYMIDLRQEFHGYADDISVSWYKDRDWANVGLSTTAVEANEDLKLATLRGIETKFIPQGSSDTKKMSAITTGVTTTRTERETATQAGFHYVRFAVTDHVWPSASIVDEFLNFYQNLPQDAWLHFHCHAGKGRTASFMAMCDILQNLDVPLEDIVKRQYLLGGSNLLDTEDDDEWKVEFKQDRAEKITLFYQYVKEQKAQNFATTWSVWLAGHKNDV